MEVKLRLKILRDKLSRIAIFSFENFYLKIINDYIYKREGLKRIKYDESAWQLII